MQNSPYLFPNSIGNNDQVQDLVSQIIKYRPPRPEDVTGGDPPYIFIQRSDNGIIRQDHAGRDDADKVGPMKYTLEFWIIIITLGETFDKSQAQSMDIVSAVLTTLGKNKVLNNKVGADPIAIDSDWIDLPFLLDTSNKEMVSRNIVFRPKVFVNLR